MSDLTLIFSSLSVGVIFTLVILVFFITLLVPGYKWSIFIIRVNRLNGAMKNSSLTPFMLSTILLPLLYGSGLLIQDFTDYLTDKEFESTHRYICDFNILVNSEIKFLSIPKICLGDEGELRAKSLLKEKYYSLEEVREDVNFVQINGLANSLIKGANIKFLPDSQVYAKPQYLEKNIKSGVVLLYDIDCEDDECSGAIRDKFTSDKESGFPAYSLKEFEKNVNILYYEAKNWAYREIDNHYSELEEIQRRIDFSRSVFLVLIYGVASVLLAFTFRLLYYISYLMIRLARAENVSLRLDVFYITKKYKLVTPVWIVMIVFCFITSAGYRNAEKVYNERVFGYYSSYCNVAGNNAKDCYKF